MTTRAMLERPNQERPQKKQMWQSRDLACIETPIHSKKIKANNVHQKIASIKIQSKSPS